MNNPHSYGITNILFIHVKDNKTDCSNYQGTLSNSCNNVTHTLLSRQTPYIDGTTENHHHEF
jgi:hypothetical protein